MQTPMRALSRSSVVVSAVVLLTSLTGCDSEDPVKIRSIGAGQIQVSGDTGTAVDVPTCDESILASGTNNPDFVGLVSCYVDAQKNEDVRALAPLTALRGGRPLILGPRDLAFARAARVGEPSAKFVANEIDGSSETVTLRYKNGQRQTLGIYRANPSSNGSWRPIIGREK